MRLRITAGGLVLLVALLAAVPASAQPFTVTRFDDPAPNACAPGDCSLREAIRAANAAAGADTIALGAGTYQLSQVGTGEDAALNGDLDVTDDLTVTGAGLAATTVDANGGTTLERVFSIDPASGPPNPTVAFADLKLTDGAGSFGAGVRASNEATTAFDRVSISGNQGSSFGIAIFNDSDAVMTIRDSVIDANTASGGFSAGIFNQNDARMTIERTSITRNINASGFGGGVMNQNSGVLTIRDSTISGNSVESRGGGLFLQNDSVTRIENSTISGNSATDPDANDFEHGGGIAAGNQARVTLVNSTVSGNTADDGGGAMYLSGASVVRVENSTVTANTADFDGTPAPVNEGGGILVDAGLTGSVTLVSSILAQNNNATAPNCFGPVGSGGFNLIGNAQECAFTPAAGDQLGTASAPIDALLGPLAANGGPTQTHLPAIGSPGIDAGLAGSLSTDQRGLARTSNLATVANPPGAGATDIGAVELQAADIEGTCKGVPVRKTDGTDGPDALVGTGASDLLSGFAGNDSVKGTGGADCIDGGEGNDKLSGGGGKDKLKGAEGKDKFKAGGGKDKVKAAGDGKDKVNCGGGKDKATVDERDKVGASCERVAVKS